MKLSAAPIDDAIVETYRQCTETVDDILTDPQNARAFADAVRARLPAGASSDDRTILRRLITLRKRRGALPAIARRGSKPR